MLIVLIGIVYWIGTTFGDSAGAIAIAALIVFLVSLAVHEDHKDWEAYQNRRDYWAMNGADRVRARKRWQDEAKMQDMRMRAAAEERRAARMRKEMRESQREEPESMVRCFVCANCHKAVWRAGRAARLDGKRVLAYYCPECGKRGMIVR